MERYSVLISVYYKEKPQYFKESLKSMATQSVLPYDFVIVCDGLLGKELDNVLADFEKNYSSYFIIKIVRLEKCSGLGNALNVGLKECQCDVVARMDSDDIAKTDRVKLQIEAMKEHNADMVGASVEEFDKSPENVIAIRKMPQTHEEILMFSRQRNPFNHPVMLFSKNAVMKAGGYIECQWFEDYYLWLRMLKSGAKAYNIPDSLLYMRAGENMYARRGGLSYGITAVKFRWKIHRMGCSSLMDFIKSAGGQFLVSIVPNKVRIFIYKKILRKSK